MINFKSFLIESRSAPLYHATSSNRATMILVNDVMLTGASKEPGLEIPTVSLTRDFTFARHWLDEQGWPDKGVIFELDQQKLAQRYKIVPYNFFGASFLRATPARYAPSRSHITNKQNFKFENQFEEAVLSHIRHVTKYITKVWVGAKTPETFIDECNILGIPVKRHDKL